MDKTISVEMFQRWLEEYREKAEAEYSFCDEVVSDIFIEIEEFLYYVPAVEVAEVKRGEWKDYYNNKYNNQLYVCSVCGKQALYEYFKDELDNIKTRQVLSVVCPHCEAKMDGGSNNGKEPNETLP